MGGKKLVRSDCHRVFAKPWWVERLDVAVAVTVPVTSRIHLSGLNCIEIKPSDIMKDHAKVELLFSIFDANFKLSFSKWHDAMADANMFADVLKKADLLFVMLSSRFQNHVKRKVKVCQQSNRCLAWAKKNLALVACWMIVACHLKEDISCIDESKCLLANLSGNKFLDRLEIRLSLRYHEGLLRLVGKDVVIPSHQNTHWTLVTFVTLCVVVSL